MKRLAVLLGVVANLHCATQAHRVAWHQLRCHLNRWCDISTMKQRHMKIECIWHACVVSKLGSESRLAELLPMANKGTTCSGGKTQNQELLLPFCHPFKTGKTEKLCFFQCPDDFVRPKGFGNKPSFQCSVHLGRISHEQQAEIPQTGSNVASRQCDHVDWLTGRAAAARVGNFLSVKRAQKLETGRYDVLAPPCAFHY